MFTNLNKETNDLASLSSFQSELSIKLIQISSIISFHSSLLQNQIIIIKTLFSKLDIPNIIFFKLFTLFLKLFLLISLVSRY